MANLNRKKIKEYVKKRLVDANTKAGGNVYVNRITDLEQKKLPALQIRTLRETAVRVNQTPVTYERTLNVGVVCICRADDKVDDALDELAAQVEDALIGVEIYGLLDEANRVEYQGTDLTLEMADSQLGAALVAFEIQFDTRHDPIVGDLEGVDFKFKAKDAKPDDEFLLQSDVDLPTV